MIQSQTDFKIQQHGTGDVSAVCEEHTYSMLTVAYV